MNGPISYSSKIINKNGISQMDLSVFSSMPPTQYFSSLIFFFFFALPHSPMRCVSYLCHHIFLLISFISLSPILFSYRASFPYPLSNFCLFWDRWMFLKFIFFPLVCSFFYFHCFSLYLFIPPICLSFPLLPLLPSQFISFSPSHPHKLLWAIRL